MKQENKQNIAEIVMKPTAICFCPLGDDWYTNEFYITIEPDKYFPDYCDIEKYLNGNIRGKSLIIEDAVGMVYDYIKNEYEPKTIQVVSYVNDVISHSPVIVTK